MADTTTRIRLGDPGALVAALPHLLGFTPTDSLVAVGLRRPRSRLCLTLRLDLAAATETAVLDQLAAHLRRADATEVVVVVAGSPAAREGPRDAVPPPGDLPHRAIVRAVRDVCERRRLVLRDALWADRGRWWSYVCTDQSCCPPEGTPVDPRAAEQLAAELALSGRAPLPDREALERCVAGQFPLGEAVAARTFAGAYDGDAATVSDGDPWAALTEAQAVLSAAVERCVPGGPGIAHTDRARLCVLLTRPLVRDGALRWLGGPLHEAAQALWHDLIRAAPPPWAAAPATLLALYVYARGDGPFARVCADRALADDPGHTLAGLVHDMLDRGVPPEDVAAAARDVVRRLDGGTPPRGGTVPRGWTVQGGGGAPRGGTAPWGGGAP